MKKAVVFGDKNALCKVYTDERMKLLGSMVSLYPQKIDQTDFNIHTEAMKNAEIIFTTYRITPFEADQIKKLFPSAKILLYAAGSVQRIARAYLNCGIEIVSAWAANAIPVAEFVAAQIVLANKGYFCMHAIYRLEGYAKARETALSYPANRHASVGILGAGMVGKKVISLIKNFGVTVYVYDPFLTDEDADALGVSKADLNFIFKHCHTISNHIADLPQTKKILTEDLFCAMRPDAVFVNTARGAQVDHAGLVKALRQGPGRLALLDVTDPEPLGDCHPLWELPNTIITPHIAGTYEEATPLMLDLLTEELKRYVNHEPRKYRVTYDMLQTMA